MEFTPEQTKQLLHWSEGLNEKVLIDDIQKVEIICNIKFPDDYVAFKTQFNGLYIESGKVYVAIWERYGGQPLSLEDVGETKTEYGISVLSNLEQVVELNKIFVTEATKNQRPSFPVGLFPFSYGAGGEILLFATNKSDKRSGSVWVWPTTDETWGLGGNLYVAFIADSFADFLFNKLRD